MVAAKVWAAGTPAPGDVDRAVNEYVDSLNLRLAAHEDALTGLLVAHFDRAERVAVDKLTGAKNRDRWTKSLAGGEVKRLGALDIFNPIAWVKALAEDFRSWLRAIFGDVGGDMARRLEIVWTIAAAADAMERQIERLTSIAETTAARIDAALTQAQDDGDDVDMAADAVRAVFDQARESRVPQIAETETTGAAGAAVTSVGDTAEQAGFPVEKRWWSMLDDRVRPTHRVAHGQTVDVDDMFIVGGAELEFPGDPAAPIRETINCRCRMLLIPKVEAVKTVPIIWSGASTVALSATRTGTVEVKAGSAQSRTRAAYRAHISRRRALGLPIPSEWWARAGMDPMAAASSRTRRPEITDATNRNRERAALRAVDRFARADGDMVPDVPESRLFSRSEKAAYGAFTETWNRLAAAHVARTGGQPSPGQRSWITRQANQAAAESVRRSDARALIAPAPGDSPVPDNPESAWARDIKAAIDRMHAEAPQSEWFKRAGGRPAWDRLTPEQRRIEIRTRMVGGAVDDVLDMPGARRGDSDYQAEVRKANTAVRQWYVDAVTALSENPDGPVPKIPAVLRGEHAPDRPETMERVARVAAALLPRNAPLSLARSYVTGGRNYYSDVAVRTADVDPRQWMDDGSSRTVSQALGEHGNAVVAARLLNEPEPEPPAGLVALIGESTIDDYVKDQWSKIPPAGVTHHDATGVRYADIVDPQQRRDAVTLAAASELLGGDYAKQLGSIHVTDSPPNAYLQRVFDAYDAHLIEGKPLKRPRVPPKLQEEVAVAIEEAVRRQITDIRYNSRVQNIAAKENAPDDDSFRREAEIRAIGQSILDRAARNAGPDATRALAVAEAARVWTAKNAEDDRNDVRNRDRQSMRRQLELRNDVLAAFREAVDTSQTGDLGWGKWERGVAPWGTATRTAPTFGGVTYRAGVLYVTQERSDETGVAFGQRILLDDDGRLWRVNVLSRSGDTAVDDWQPFTDIEPVDNPAAAKAAADALDEWDLTFVSDAQIDAARSWVDRAAKSRPEPLLAALAEIRQLGGDMPSMQYDVEMDKEDKGMRYVWDTPAAEAAAREAFQNVTARFYPTEWVDTFRAKFPELKVGVVSRGYAMSNGIIKTSPRGGWSFGSEAGPVESLEPTALHEIGHFMETSIPGLKGAEWTFWHRRTGSDIEGIRWLGHGHENHERAHPDEFTTAYVGKVYSNSPDGDWEVFTVGIEAAFAQREGTWDTDHIAFVVGALATFRGTGVAPTPNTGV